MSCRSWQVQRAMLVLAIGASAAPALADVGGVASGVLAQLTALARPAITLGLIWLGVLIMVGRGSVQVFVTFLIGLVIVLSGGIW
jgi:TrbC/VIRB2 pilin